MPSLSQLKKELKSKADPKRAKASKWFFKTGPGQYGEGDVFIGIKSADMRSIAKEYRELKLSDIQKILNSKIHEERQVALLILANQMNEHSVSIHLQKKIYNFYLANTDRVNNWDLVDLSADKIIGEYLKDKPKTILYKLAKSKSLWERRVSIIATFQFIKAGEFKETLRVAEILVRDEHDLIHKAVGWMLREVGKKSLTTEEKFLKKHYQTMPRTMLRYAIERFPEPKRQAYLKGRI